jgi:hypothetical protein
LISSLCRATFVKRDAITLWFGSGALVESFIFLSDSASHIDLEGLLKEYVNVFYIF